VTGRTVYRMLCLGHNFVSGHFIRENRNNQKSVKTSSKKPRFFQPWSVHIAVQGIVLCFTVLLFIYDNEFVTCHLSLSVWNIMAVRSLNLCFGTVPSHFLFCRMLPPTVIKIAQWRFYIGAGGTVVPQILPLYPQFGMQQKLSLWITLVCCHE